MAFSLSSLLPQPTSSSMLNGHSSLSDASLNNQTKREDCPTFLNAEASKEFTCSICLRVMKDPSDIGCPNGHIYCYACAVSFIQRHFQEVNDHQLAQLNCPDCRCPITNPVHSIRRLPFVQRQIKRLRVKCPNHRITPAMATVLSWNASRYCKHYQTCDRQQNRKRARSRNCMSIPELSPDSDLPTPRESSLSSSASRSSSRSRSRSRSRSPSRSRSMLIEPDRHSNTDSFTWSQTEEMQTQTEQKQQAGVEIIEIANDQECNEQGEKEKEESDEDVHMEQEEEEDLEDEDEEEEDDEHEPQQQQQQHALREQQEDPSQEEEDKEEDSTGEIENDAEKEICHNLCEWHGPWSDLRAHLLECRFQVLQCKHCRRLYQRMHHDQHKWFCPNLPVPCSTCLKIVPRSQLPLHKEICPKQEIICECGKRLLREEQALHKENNCPEHLMQCPQFFVYGCHQMMKRKSIDSHMKKQQASHLLLVTRQCSVLTNLVHNLAARVQQLEGERGISHNE